MKIKGTKGRDILIGSTESDIIKGGKGRDLIDGREGSDVFLGGKGADTFILRADQADLDYIVDFQPGRDQIILDSPYGWLPVYDQNNGNIYSVSHFTLAYGPVVGHVTPGLVLSYYDDLIAI